MHVKVVSIEGCDGASETVKLVKETAVEMGLSIDFEHVVIQSREEARMHRHIGSPTVQIDGLDIEPEARVLQSFGLT